MVRLKVNEPKIVTTSASLFQFQDGSIKREIYQIPENGGNNFQFQDGSIKRDAASVLSRHKHDFNSNMVRLKGSYPP